VIQLVGDIDAAFVALGLKSVAVGALVLRDLLGVDRGVVARWTQSLAHLMPHGGIAVVQAIVREVESRGIRAAINGDESSDAAELRREFPEARSEVDARALAALAHAASPLAVDMLLGQHDAWMHAPCQEGEDGGMGGAGEGDFARVVTDPVRDRVLRRMIDPPTVAIVGPANVGKSTLVNALAGRAVSIVADVPGTTRDHVGVTLNLAGLVVRAIDTPGLREVDPAASIEHEAIELAMQIAARADLVVLCGDAFNPPALHLPASRMPGQVTPGRLSPGQARIMLATRRDLGEASFDADVRVSATSGEGIAELVALIRERLVPASMLDDRPWRFWATASGSAQGLRMRPEE
jgi:tRNA U34 5-carboxymethylaminomethyl modifying GTPase MnmE/TrmE